MNEMADHLALAEETSINLNTLRKWFIAPNESVVCPTKNYSAMLKQLIPSAIVLGQL